MIDWTSARFLSEAEEWIRTQVEVVGEIEQPHVQPWSTVLRVVTDREVLWFKAVTDVDAFEVPLTAILAAVRPNALPELVAVDGDRRWMLMRDGRTRLRELMSTSNDLWRSGAFLPEYAELQIAVTPLAGELLTVGVPAEPLAGLPERIAWLLATPEFLMLDEPGGLTEDARAGLEALIPDITAMCRELARYGISETSNMTT